MSVRKILPVFLFILWLAFLPCSSGAQAEDVKIADVKVTQGEGPVEIEADELFYDHDERLYEAHGRVEMVRGDMTLKADHARLNMATQEMSAWGNVTLTEGEDVLECERLEINIETRLGKVYRAKLFLKDQNFHIQGEEAEKLGESRYRVRNGSFTTCEGEHPPWRFSAKEVDVTLEGFGIVKKPTFYIKDIPSLYLPVTIFPVKRERQSGFLLPSGGYSNKHGLEVETAFYWAISKDMDATFYESYLGDRGFKEGLEYRYALTRDTKGEAKVYYIDDHYYGDDRYAFYVEHEQKLPYETYLKADLNYASDIQYTQDFDNDFPTATRIDSRSLRQLRSVIFGGKNWDQFSLLAQGMFFESLTNENNDATVQKLPQINFSAHPQSFLGTPIFFDVNASYVNFWRREGVEAQRWDLFPQISYPTRLFNVLKVEPNAGFRETLYLPTHDPTGQLSGWQSRELFTAGLSTAVEFFRIYEATELLKLSNLYKVAKWMHTFEPSVSYNYNPQVDQNENLFFDTADQIPGKNEITYGFTTRLIGKPVKETVIRGPREYGKLKISQSYSLGDPFEIDIGKERDFSNIRGELWWRFGPYTTAHADTEWNPYTGDFYQLNGTVVLRDQRNDAIEIEYRNTKDQIHEANLYTRVKTIDPLYLYVALRYNLLDKAWVEQIYGLEYQAQCWSAGFTIDNIAASPDGTQQSELKAEVYFSLLGVGALGHRPSWANFQYSDISGSFSSPGSSNP
jgi:LPS-assembly protein